MELNQELFEQIGERLLKQAKMVRASYKYSEDEKMAQVAGVITPNGNVSMLSLLWRDNEEKRQKMRALCLTAKSVDALAVALITDSRWCDGVKFAEYFKIEPPTAATGEKFEEYQRNYLKILNRYGGSIKNLPRQLWNEAVIIALKGPGIKPRMFMASYVEGRRDTVEWLPPKPPSESYEVMINLLPDWWTVQ